MLVNDIFYGNVEMPEVVGNLLKTDALKRLGRIHQSGGLFLVNPAYSHTRLEHSIGVMLLIKKLGGSELEQIAGLLHDVSHTAFSHVGDYVYENSSEDYHEKVFEQLIKASEIPNVLTDYGYDVAEIINGQFKILEQPLPHLCADRVDYTLRDSYYGGLIKREEVLDFLKHVVIHNGVVAVDSEDHALWINDTHDRLNRQVFNLPLHLYANKELANIIKEGLESGFLSEDDLFKDDTFLLNKIRSSSKGYEAIKAIKQHKGFTAFLKGGDTLKIKKRGINAAIV